MSNQTAEALRQEFLEDMDKVSAILVRTVDHLVDTNEYAGQVIAASVTKEAAVLNALIFADMFGKDRDTMRSAAKALSEAFHASVLAVYEQILADELTTAEAAQ